MITKRKLNAVIDILRIIIDDADKKGAFKSRGNSLYNPAAGYDKRDVFSLGGWYAAGKYKQKKIKTKIDECILINGRDLLAEDLGFNDYDEMLAWADNNPIIWYYVGGRHFFNSDSWNVINSGKPMHSIIVHLERVKDYLEGKIDFIFTGKKYDYPPYQY